MKINGKPDGGGGGGVITSLIATSNGTYMPTTGVDGFAPVDVSVEFVTEVLSVTSNGIYSPGEGVDGYSQVSVDVQPLLQDKSFTVNGSYTADEGYYGLSTVTVNVPGPVTGVLSVSDNGTYYPGTGVDGFSQVTVDVHADGYTQKDIAERTFCSTFISLNDNSISYVDDYAFRNCSSLTTINLQNCHSIGKHAFSNCYSLNLVSLPICISVGDYGFGGCSSLTTLDLPSCTYLGSWPFVYCSLLSSISIPFYSKINFSTTFLFGTYTPLMSYLELPFLKDINSNIGADIIFSVNTLSICRDVAVIPNADRTVNFRYVTSIYVPSETYNYFLTAQYWSGGGAKYISFPHTGSEPLISIDNGLIYGSTKAVNKSLLPILGVSSVSVTGVSLPNCIEVGYLTFWSTNVSYLDLPICSYIGKSAFGYCYSLTSIYLPMCSYIDINAFDHCLNLVNINLPECSYIGSYAFNVAGRYLDPFNLTLGYSGVVGCGEDVFINANIKSIFVPASLVDAYKESRSVWYWFSNRIFPIPEP